MKAAWIALTMLACAHTATPLALTSSGAPDEVAVARRLERLARELPLSRFIVSRPVTVRRGPHSWVYGKRVVLGTAHPDDDMLLAAFLEEQAHVWLGDRRRAVQAAVSELRARYPNPPEGYPAEVARDLDDTYAHLVICWLQVRALGRLVGEVRARASLERMPIYRWINGVVLRDRDWLGSLVRRHGLGGFAEG